METTDALEGFDCRDCGARLPFESSLGRCPDCGGVLDAAYDLDAVEFPCIDRAESASMWDLGAPLPIPSDDAVTLGEGGTPLVDCPGLAGELGVERVLVKDEGVNPTGSVTDRDLSVAVSAAAADGATDVALPSTGDDGQSAAAYAGRAGVDAHVFVPARAGFVQKAMINVHGGDMSVVGGRLREATDAFEDASTDHDWWRSVAPAATPFGHEGRKTLLYEVVADLGRAPDVLVLPTGHGVGLVAARKAAIELVDLGVVEAAPRLYGAQATGCAPITRAIEEDDPVEPWEHPDTICAGVEVPEPAVGEWARESIRGTGGAAVATDDDAILESAVTVAGHEGVSMAPSGAAAASGAWALAERGEFHSDDTVVLVNTASGSKTADVLRSHLMGQGV